MNLLLTKMPQLLVQKGIQDEVDEMTTRYDHITALVHEYTNAVKKEILDQEMEKESLFKESKLNIKLGKYKGYDSVNDLYTFQDAFEKIYLRTTPRRLIADLLKNNHLDEPALSLVRTVDNIDEIWDR